MTHWIFTINPGSTSTKTALFADCDCRYESVVRHDATELQHLPNLADQLPLRLEAIERSIREGLKSAGLPDPSAIDAFVGRGGILHALESGTYAINDEMIADLESNRYGIHASNLGAPIAYGLAAHHQRPSFIVDPVTVDEMIPLSYYTGLPQLRRRSIFHALNHKAMARQAAGQIGKPYESLNLIVAHLGGGISVGAHRAGRVIDVNNAIEEGPFSPERSGTLPTQQLLDLYESGKYTPAQIRALLVGRGGLFAYTGTANAQAIEEEAATNPQRAELLQAMAYQVSKSIGAMAVSLKGQIDAIVLTGGLAYSPLLTQEIRDRVSFLAPLIILPGENEMKAMAEGAWRVLEGLEKPRIYAREE